MVVEFAARNAAQSDVLIHTRTGSIGIECKEYFNGGPVDANTLLTRAGSMGYDTLVMELPESAFEFPDVSPPNKGKHATQEAGQTRYAVVTNTAVKSLLKGSKLDKLPSAVQVGTKVRLTFRTDVHEGPSVNRMLRSMLLRKARANTNTTDVVVLVGPEPHLLPEGCNVWFEDPWKLESATSANFHWVAKSYFKCTTPQNSKTALETPAEAPPYTSTPGDIVCVRTDDTEHVAIHLSNTSDATELETHSSSKEAQTLGEWSFVKDPRNRRVKVVCATFSLPRLNGGFPERLR